MNGKGKHKRSVRWLFALRRYLSFFLLMAFVITCCMVLFLNMMSRTTGLVLSHDYVERVRSHPAQE